MNAIGDTPLAGEQVVLIDPDTKKPVTGPVAADDEGKINVRVPENKKYDVKIVSDAAPPPAADVEPPPRQQDVASHLYCRFFDEQRKPLAKEKLKITGDGGRAFDLVTDEDGCIASLMLPGTYEIEIKKKKYKAHTLLVSELKGEAKGHFYEFIVGADEDDDQIDEDWAKHERARAGRLPSKDEG